MINIINIYLNNDVLIKLNDILLRAMRVGTSESRFSMLTCNLTNVNFASWKVKISVA